MDSGPVESGVASCGNTHRPSLRRCAQRRDRVADQMDQIVAISCDEYVAVWVVANVERRVHDRADNRDAAVTIFIDRGAVQILFTPANVVIRSLRGSIRRIWLLEVPAT